MLRVMVVEDEEFVRKKLVYFPDYEKLNMSVIAEAKNGQEGMDLIRQMEPDIVIADISMPLKNGLEMIEETLEYDYTAIIVSGCSDFAYAQKALKYGVSDYLLKPVDVEELEESLKNASDIFRRKRQYYKADYRIEQLDIPDVSKVRNELAERIVQYIHEHFDSKISLTDLQDDLHYSESLLNKRFKEYTSLTFNEYLNRYRIKKSIEYLHRKDLSILDISFLCGFSNPKYFSRVFKKYIGIRPKDFEKKLS